MTPEEIERFIKEGVLPVRFDHLSPED